MGVRRLTGTAGIDTVAYSLSWKEVAFFFAGESFTQVDGITGSDLLTSVERLQFRDVSVAVDVSGNAGQAFRLYTAAFSRLPDQQGLGYWISELDRGKTLLSIATSFVESTEFKSIYGNNPNPRDVISKLYRNILGRDGDPKGVDYWLGQLSAGQSMAGILLGFSESPENKRNTSTITNRGIFFEPSLATIPPVPFPRTELPFVDPIASGGGSFSGNNSNTIFIPGDPGSVNIVGL